MKFKWYEVVGIASPLVGAVIFGTHWLSEEQQLKRACWSAAQASLVSPATASLAGFSIHQSGSELDTLKDIDAKIADVEKNIASASTLVANAKEATNAASKVDIDREGTDAFMAKLSSSADAAKILSEGEKVLANSRAMLEELQAKRKVAVDSKIAEVWLDIDSQNRAGAMLRSKGVCAYRDVGKPASVDSVELFQVTSR
jgi:hypothetical protein